MIASNSFIVFVLSITLSKAAGLPYSKVYVQSGPDVVPMEYLNYGPPAAPAQVLGQLTAPFPNVVPVPCVGPCAPSPPVATIPTSAKVVAYKAPVPNAPVMITPKKDDLSYQYSYVVYDENTGDQKAQSELSNKGVVQGQYSLIQPDGYVREVLYTADDLKGFNAVVNSFLPSTQPTDVKASEEKKPVPCSDAKSGALVELSDTKNSDVPAVETVSTEATTTVTMELPSTSPGAQSIPDGVLSYNDILKCLQAALKGTGTSPKPTASPLTYVILNKPC